MHAVLGIFGRENGDAMFMANAERKMSGFTANKKNKRGEWECRREVLQNKGVWPFLDSPPSY